MHGLDGGLVFPVETRRCTKLSILFPFVSVSNRFPPNGNDSSPLSFSTSSSHSVFPSLLTALPKLNACHITNAVNSTVTGLLFQISDQNTEIVVQKYSTTVEEKSKSKTIHSPGFWCSPYDSSRRRSPTSGQWSRKRHLTQCQPPTAWSTCDSRMTWHSTIHCPRKGPKDPQRRSLTGNRACYGERE